MRQYVKRRAHPAPGSIPALQSFRKELWLYTEIAPVAGIRVPTCLSAECDETGTRLVLEDLSGWRVGGDPCEVARVLAQLHRDRLVGCVADVVRAEFGAGTTTLLHGDISLRNVRTGPAGEIAFLDWEDVRCGPGVADLAWLLVSSVEPAQWRDTIDAYGTGRNLHVVLPGAACRGLLSLADTPQGSAEAVAWVARLVTALRYLDCGLSV